MSLRSKNTLIQGDLLIEGETPFTTAASATCSIKSNAITATLKPRSEPQMRGENVNR